jgi:hypothetical protein
MSANGLDPTEHTTVAKRSGSTLHIGHFDSSRFDQLTVIEFDISGCEPP